MPPTDKSSSSGAVTVGLKRQHYQVLDGIRGVAIIGVLLTHGAYLIENHLAARLFQVGWAGVDLFFVLSGFLITGILINTKAAVNRGTSFYARRILRIFPIYYLTLGVVLVAQTQWHWLASVADMPSLLDRLSYVFYFKNIAPLWNHGDAHQTLLAHFWSLAVEEQFYFVWPLVVWHLPTKTVYKLCGVALCLTLAVRVFAGGHFGYGAWLQFSPLTRADGLFAGSGLAAMLASNYRPSKKLLACLTAACSLSFLVIALTGYRQFFYGGPFMSTIGYSSYAILFGVLIAYCLESGQATVPRLLQARWLRGFGRYSYGLYVFHLPIYFVCDHLAKEWFGMTQPLHGFRSFLYLGALIAIAYAIAWISYNAFEQQFLKLKRFFEPAFHDTVRSFEPDLVAAGLESTTEPGVQPQPVHSR
jgi:peptidoglycan/LPS O-acetylase OafA/YrhL